MHLIPYAEAIALSGLKRNEFLKLVDQGQLVIRRGEGKSSPIFVSVESLRALGYDVPPDGEPSVEELVREAIKPFIREIDALHQRLRALERLHVYRHYSNHCLPPASNGA